MWDIDKHYEVRKQHYESIRREVEQHRLARQLGFTEADTLRSLAAGFRGWLFGVRQKLRNGLVERKTIMDDFDAKNHLRDLRREADNERLAQSVEAGAEVKKQEVAHRSRFNFSVRLLAWISRKLGRRAASGMAGQ